jgi:hypothetical protein
MRLANARWEALSVSLTVRILSLTSAAMPQIVEKNAVYINTAMIFGVFLRKNVHKNEKICISEGGFSEMGNFFLTSHFEVIIMNTI